VIEAGGFRRWHACRDALIRAKLRLLAWHCVPDARYNP
jgi:hypothetical protein